MSYWNSKIKYNGKILKKMNKNCLGKYQNNKWSYMRMFNFFSGKMRTSPGDLLPPAVNDTCESSAETDFCQNAGEYIIII